MSTNKRRDELENAHVVTAYLSDFFRHLEDYTRSLKLDDMKRLHGQYSCMLADAADDYDYNRILQAAAICHHLGNEIEKRTNHGY
jgi:hypothetical protein